MGGDCNLWQSMREKLKHGWKLQSLARYEGESQTWVETLQSLSKYEGKTQTWVETLLSLARYEGESQNMDGYFAIFGKV